VNTIVITGARGYIGSALAKKLAGEGYGLRLVSRSSMPASCGRADQAVEYVQADLRQEESWRALLKGAQAVVHLSARTDLRAADDDPEGDHVLNVEPVRALIRAAERYRLAVPVIFASSVMILGDTHINPFDEKAPDRPSCVYGRHKLECEVMLADATRRGLIKACSLRLSTVYGYGIHSANPNSGVINMMIRRAIDGQALTLYGDGSYIRDFIHVGDVCDAFHMATVSPHIWDGQHYVIATGRGYTLAEAFKCVAHEAYRATGRVAEVRRVPEPPDLHSIQRCNYIGDSSLFRKVTGWRPQINLKSGIRDYFQHLIADSERYGPRFPIATGRR
jgi:nucleoside-diphosphate-sugar epimerase